MDDSNSNDAPIDLNQVPAGSPPPGVVPHFYAYNSLARVWYSICSILLIIMLISYGIRIYTRRRIMKHFGWDDVTSSIAFLGVIYFYIVASCSFSLVSTGRHIWDVPAAVLTSDRFLIITYLEDSWPTLVFLLIRLSFMILYLQVFRPFKWVRWSCYVSTVVMSGFYVSYFIVQAYGSTPENGETWAKNFNTPRFFKGLKLALPLAIVSLVFDIIILILPLAAVYQLQMTRTRKIEVSVAFSTALIAIVASALSVVYREQLNVNNADFTHGSGIVLITTFVEQSVGITVLCMPMVSMFYRNFWTRRRSSTSPLSGKSSRPGHHEIAGKGLSKSSHFKLAQRRDSARTDTGTDTENGLIINRTVDFELEENIPHITV